MPKKRDENAPYWQQMRESERSIIAFALEHGQSVRGAATLLGVSANYLRERTRELNIATPEIKPGPKPGTKPPRAEKPDLRVVTTNGAHRPPALPVGVPLHAETVDEDEDDDVDNEDAEDDEDDEDGESEDALDAETDEDDDDEEDDAEDTDTGGEAQSSN
jgi:hypothetical protein